MRDMIGVLVHFSLNAKPLTAITMAEYLLEIMSPIMIDGCSSKIVIETRNPDSFSSEKIEMNNLEFSLDKIIKHISPSACYISIKVYNSKGICASSYGCIARTNGLTQFMIGHEQTIFILVSYDTWQKRAETLIKEIKSICSYAPQVTYVAIDKENIAPRSIYTANTRLFSNPYSTSTIDPESRIPGIYWAQYIHNNMLDHNTKKRMTEEICTHDIICEDIGTGVWIQTTRTIQTDSINCQKTACAILELEAPSYAIDENTIRKYMHLQPWLFEKYPFM